MNMPRFELSTSLIPDSIFNARASPDSDLSSYSVQPRDVRAVHNEVAVSAWTDGRWRGELAEHPRSQAQSHDEVFRSVVVPSPSWAY
jgi:hypothetical protein